MTTRKLPGIVALALALTACGAQAQERNGISRECRREIVELCGTNRESIRACLIEKRSAVSADCRIEIAARAAGRTALPAGMREIAFGSDPRQRVDFLPATGTRGPAPLVVFIHGGGWAIGDKRSGTGAKPAHFAGQGYAFASTNYRLVPQARVEDQAADIALALAALRKQPGVDPSRIVLTGHSAGAHLAALVATDPRYLAAAGVPMTAIRAVVLLDGAGYDVPRQIRDPRTLSQSMYRNAFGSDPARQRALSPITHAAAPNAADWLILPVASRADAVAQSEAFAAALRTAKTQAMVTRVPNSSHMLINQNLGQKGDFATAQVDNFLARALR